MANLEEARQTRCELEAERKKLAADYKRRRRSRTLQRTTIKLDEDYADVMRRIRAADSAIAAAERREVAA